MNDNANDNIYKNCVGIKAVYDANARIGPENDMLQEKWGKLDPLHYKSYSSRLYVYFLHDNSRLYSIFVGSSGSASSIHIDLNETGSTCFVTKGLKHWLVLNNGYSFVDANNLINACSDKCDSLPSDREDLYKPYII
jgi:hypothetical protein